MLNVRNVMNAKYSIDKFSCFHRVANEGDRRRLSQFGTRHPEQNVKLDVFVLLTNVFITNET